MIKRMWDRFNTFMSRQNEFFQTIMIVMFIISTAMVFLAIALTTAILFGPVVIIFSPIIITLAVFIYAQFKEKHE